MGAYTLNERECKDLSISMRREWILTNGLGGYAMGTASGINTRRYHGLLVAATRPPTTRMVLLASIDAFAEVDGKLMGISGNQYPGTIHPDGHTHLQEFSVSNVAIWRRREGEMAIDRLVAMTPGKNVTTIAYRNVGARPTTLTLRPLVCHKFYHGGFTEQKSYPMNLQLLSERTVVEHGGVSLFLRHDGARRTPIHGWYYRFEHAREFDRGLEGREDHFCPCELMYVLQPGEAATLVVSADELAEPYLPEQEPIPEDLEGRLAYAAERFIVHGRNRETILAGYPWFTDWGRDTMIALPGICLATGRVETARSILRGYAAQMHQGLIPNRFVEEGERPEYNTVDASLWFVNAVYLTLRKEWDEAFAREILPPLRDLLEWHVNGTLYNIKVDPADGLLSQGQPGVQLTWMDAKVGDWVVTPRHGKPVEINGLWINALRVFEWLAGQLGESPDPFKALAEKAESCFDDRFWHEGRGHYLDTVDPTDASLRPNQVIAMALPFAPAKGDHARRALHCVRTELYTPFGLRTLGPHEPSYRGRYEGPLPQLDAAYHQGTAWPWLLGPYAVALRKVMGDDEGAVAVLSKAADMLDEYGLGGIAEVYDGNAPQRANGCPWQAWSVGTILEALKER